MTRQLLSAPGKELDAIRANEKASQSEREIGNAEMGDAVLDYRPPEPPKKFRWRNLPQLFLLVIIVFAGVYGGLVVLDRFMGWLRHLDH